MKAIHILRTPPGFADEHIREQWIGLTIPLVTEEDAGKLREMFPSNGENHNGYIVSGEDACNALAEANRSEALDFWSRPMPPEYFIFNRDCCEIVTVDS